MIITTTIHKYTNQRFGYMELPGQLNALYRQSLDLYGSVFADDHSCESLYCPAGIFVKNLSDLPLIISKINPIMPNENMLIQKASKVILDTELHSMMIKIYDNTYKNIDFLEYVFSRFSDSVSINNLSNLSAIFAYLFAKKRVVNTETNKPINEATNKSFKIKLINTNRVYDIVKIIKVNLFLAYLISFLSSSITIINNPHKEKI